MSAPVGCAHLPHFAVSLLRGNETNFSARLIELDPKYVDVIVRRWQDYAGAKAIRQSDGVAFDALLDHGGNAGVKV